MEEKILIKSERYNILKGLKILVILSVVLSAICAFVVISDRISWYNNWYYDYGEKFRGYSNALSYALSQSEFVASLVPVLCGLVISVILYYWLNSYELTITDKRIYGTVAFGKRVDLPVDSISATATITLFKGISVSTSSGRISFLVIKNSNEIYEEKNNLIIQRQNQKSNNVIQTIETKSDEADQLKKYKDLLDSGIITQDEFEAKKKQLLDL